MGTLLLPDFIYACALLVNTSQISPDLDILNLSLWVLDLDVGKLDLVPSLQPLIVPVAQLLANLQT